MPTPDVALVAPYPDVGRRHAGFSGVASYTANLAHALRDAGASVEVIAPRAPGQPDDALDGEVVVRRRFDRGPSALPAALAAARRSGAAVVHVQHELFLYGGPTSLPGLAALATGPAPVVTLHQVVDPADVDASFVRLHRVGVPPVVARTGLRAVQSLVRRVAARTIVHEPAFADVVPGATVIPHGIEVRDRPHRDDARRALGLPADAFVALCFGFLAPYKGLEVALDAAAIAGSTVHLVVAGGEHPRLAGRDPYATELRRRHGDLARFVGWVDEPDVARWFAASDVALFPYPRPFSSSGALSLALAHRTPALLSTPMARCAGMPTLTAVDPTPLELARRLVALATDPSALDELRAATADIVADRLWPEVARRHLDLYEEVSSGAVRDRRRLRAGQPG